MDRGGMGKEACHWRERRDQIPSMHFLDFINDLM